MNKWARRSNPCTLTLPSQPSAPPMIRFLLRFIGLCLLATASPTGIGNADRKIAEEKTTAGINLMGIAPGEFIT